MFSLLQKCVCPISLTKTQRFFTNSSVCKSKFLYKNPLYYTKQHLTLNINGPYVKLGITTYLRDCLGEITLLKPDYEIGDYVEEGEVIYNIESLKATNEILSPLNGELINVNNQLIKNIKYIVSSIDSKRQEPFLQTFEIVDFQNKTKLNPTNEIKTVKVQDLKKYLLENNLHTKDVLFVGHNQKLLANERMNLHLLESKNQFSDALGVAKLSYSLISSKASITQSKISYNKFKPLYVRFADIN